jgi:succinate dehydrogenase/fumarate reductase flavoprotein subunit
METRVACLFAAGEAVGGANGANRLSGNAIPEAVVFGERAGCAAAKAAQGKARSWAPRDAAEALDGLAALRARSRPADAPANAEAGAMWRDLQALMWDKVGVLRTQDGLAQALDRVRAMRRDDLPHVAPPAIARFNMELQGWYDLRAALLTAESIALAALMRQESRGAHWREDFPANDPALERNQVIRWTGEEPNIAWTS